MRKSLLIVILLALPGLPDAWADPAALAQAKAALEPLVKATCAMELDQVRLARLPKESAEAAALLARLAEDRKRIDERMKSANEKMASIVARITPQESDELNRAFRQDQIWTTCSTMPEWQSEIAKERSR